MIVMVWLDRVCVCGKKEWNRMRPVVWNNVIFVGG